MNEIDNQLEHNPVQENEDNTDQQNKKNTELQSELIEQIQTEKNIDHQIEKKIKRNIGNKIVKIIVSIAPLLCAFFIQILASIVFMFIYCIIQTVKQSVNDEIDSIALTEKLISSVTAPEMLLLISALAATFCIPFFALWYWHEIKNVNSKISKIKNIKNILKLKNLFFIIVLGIALQIGINTILSFIEWLQPKWFDDYNDLMKTLGIGTSLISVLYAGFIAPISEELICRGVILSYSKKALPFMYANILQALLFGIYHANIIQGSYAFIFGLFLGYLYKKYNSIFAPIILHMAINLSGIILSVALTNEIFSTTVMIIIMFILSLIAASISIIYFKNMKNVSLEEEELNSQLI